MYLWQSLLTVYVLFSLAAPVVAQSQALTVADHTAIQTVIEQQLAAFRQDDAAGAFALASPAIQEKFGTPAGLPDMVQTTYQPVYRPRHVVFKELQILAAVPTYFVSWWGLMAYR